jgi:hypothetical protein
MGRKDCNKTDSWRKGLLKRNKSKKKVSLDKIRKKQFF